MSSPSPATRIPPGSWVLQTGVNGFIASHIALQFLQRGFKVRGTVRDASLPSNAWLTTFPPFQSYVAAGSFEVVQVADFTAPGAFDAALRGVSAVVHTASVMTFSPDPATVVTPVVDGLRNLLEAADAAGVKAFVYTSSAPAASVSAAQPMPDGSPAVVPAERDVYAEFTVQMAYAEGPKGPEMGPLVYLASKVQAEKEIWKFVEERKPGFAANVVSPYTTVGKLLGGDDRSVAGWIKAVYQGQMFPTTIMKAFMFCHVEDVALVHVAAALDPELQGVRLQAWSDKQPFNWNDVLAIFRRLRPGNTFAPDLPDNPKLTCTTDDTEARRLLRKWGDRDWMTLEQGVADSVEGLA